MDRLELIVWATPPRPAKLLGSVRKKMLTSGLPAVLDDLDETGTLGATSTLRAKPLS